MTPHDAQVPPARGGAPTLPPEPSGAPHAPGGSPRSSWGTLAGQRLDEAHEAAQTLRPHPTLAGMPKRGPKPVQIRITADAELRAALDAMAEIAGVSRSEMARRMLMRGILSTAVQRRRGRDGRYPTEDHPLDGLPLGRRVR